MEDVLPYYKDIIGGREPSPENLAELEGRYRAIGGRSPLIDFTNEQAGALRDELRRRYPVYVGMRHWHPYIADTVKGMSADEITHAVGIVMAPHYSAMSIGRYLAAVNKANAELPKSIEFSYVESWGEHPLFIRAHTERIEEALQKFDPSERDDVQLVFTAHSLPERILASGDPYPQQLMSTARLLANALDWPADQWRFSFQSAGRTQEKWLGPDILETIDELAGDSVKNVIVCSIGFVIDHLEVLFDIDIEAKAHAAEKGIRLERSASLNADGLLIRLLADVIQTELYA